MSETYIDPDRAAWEVFKSLPKDQPIHMLNLVRLKPKAEYPEGHPDHGKDLSGLDAYRAYGRTTAPIFKRLGGRQVWVGKPEVMVTGPQAEAWDLAFIAEYSSSEAFIAMVRDPEYREFVKHRTAGVADSRLLRLAPVTPGEGFGE
ncbi:MAG: hypothetical protein JWR47_2881 [Phenylobacterium sp.]|jgi:uncharacterized protein (DUF1330 family)|uniref:DUF1330 domain-containing protein n=1 Tax=Phenylobacterium sp. TaxID=1871053 RepID=UPI002638DDBB|nr:DUF1330 domain-containing protein [Phenylobacterium sp.]MDB5436624.1 hypothetical protein [Phenylobacterium sp.]MDB5496844.1 hypothetical protein [Phenylobacterium sp.]